MVTITFDTHLETELLGRRFVLGIHNIWFGFGWIVVGVSVGQCIYYISLYTPGRRVQLDWCTETHKNRR